MVLLSFSFTVGDYLFFKLAEELRIIILRRKSFDYVLCSPCMYSMFGDTSVALLELICVLEPGLVQTKTVENVVMQIQDSFMT